MSTHIIRRQDGRELTPHFYNFVVGSSPFGPRDAEPLRANRLAPVLGIKLTLSDDADLAPIHAWALNEELTIEEVNE